jgi:hypothetical protein
MEEPLPGETAALITVFSVPGKYAFTMAPKRIEQAHYIFRPVSSCFPVSSIFTARRVVVTSMISRKLPRVCWYHF